ncbi:MAG: histidine-type phosphatase, partial [Bacteroidaceae bacterium]|nr:histidine-type phosphatase [Bacteroidaceae bacterium]
MKKLILVIAIATSACYIKAEIISKDAINADNLYKFGGSMTEYLDPQVEYSKAPKGFKPFYMSHYGRHGSRYLLSTSQYADPYNTLKEAYDKGVLTEFGKSVMDR